MAEVEMQVLAAVELKRSGRMELWCRRKRLSSWVVSVILTGLMGCHSGSGTDVAAVDEDEQLAGDTAVDMDTVPASGGKAAWFESPAPDHGTPARGTNPASRGRQTGPQAHEELDHGLTAPESALMLDGGMSMPAMLSALEDEEWGDHVNRFEQEALLDPDAQRIQDLYGQLLRESLAAHDMNLAGFGCGLSMCAGTIHVPEPEASSRYDAWRITFWEQSGLPVHVYSEYPVLFDRYREVRFFISTDPDVGSVVVPG